MTPNLALPRLLRPVLSVLAAFAFLTVLAASGASAAERGPASALESLYVLRTADNHDRFLGSAFLWGDGSVAVTADHVLRGADRVRLTDHLGQEQIGEVIARDPQRDIALIAVKARGVGLSPPPVLAETDIGGTVWALGAPLKADFTVTRGMISARPRQVAPSVPLDLIQHDAALNPGSSGGPLVDAEGRLVGMNIRIADGSRLNTGIGYAIAAADLARIVPAMINESHATLPHLGLHLRAVDRRIAAALALEPGGLLLDRVLAGGLASAAGLLPGDILLSAGVQALRHPGDLAFALEAAQARGSLDLTLIRDGAVIAVSLPLEAAQGTELATRGMAGAAALSRITAYRLEDMGIRLDDEGRVLRLTGNSPGAIAGLAPGDRILTLNGHAFDVAALRRLELTAPALLLAERGEGSTRHVMLDPWDRAAEEVPRVSSAANMLDPAIVLF
ncbi:S1C family serine protease [Szabonella alba]|uniref:Trypsin-like peptidase domain-containing protein n=1 Tax=Szabonella alba TaxID=2804194 RepID=A0A8K0XYK9_9RHOB|nr:trypsin-like peptidase domain-containing protein [Szabonella alba]MBL4916170.1 trypsin-like peptidase domain-containing protein [Szabonella alba]